MSEENNIEEVTVQEVEAQPFDPREDISYACNAENELAEDTADYAAPDRNDRAPFGVRFSANNLPSCSGGCCLMVVLLIVAFFYKPLAVFLIVFGLIAFVIPIVRLALISRFRR